MSNETEWRTPKQAARFLGISTSTLKSWRVGGVIKPEHMRKSPTGRWLYHVESIRLQHLPSQQKCYYHICSWTPGEWVRLLEDIKEEAKDRPVEVVINWPDRAPIARRTFVALVRLAGASTITDYAGKVWL